MPSIHILHIICHTQMVQSYDNKCSSGSPLRWTQCFFFLIPTTIVRGEHFRRPIARLVSLNAVLSVSRQPVVRSVGSRSLSLSPIPTTITTAIWSQCWSRCPLWRLSPVPLLPWSSKIAVCVSIIFKSTCRVMMFICARSLLWLHVRGGLWVYWCVCVCGGHWVIVMRHTRAHA